MQEMQEIVLLQVEPVWTICYQTHFINKTRHMSGPSANKQKQRRQELSNANINQTYKAD